MVGQFESSKDTVQVITESAATHIGNIATIITGAVRDIARETGEWISDVIEMREASQRAQADEQKLRNGIARHDPFADRVVAGEHEHGEQHEGDPGSRVRATGFARGRAEGHEGWNTVGAGRILYT